MQANVSCSFNCLCQCRYY